MIFLESSREADAGIVIRQSGGNGRNRGIHKRGRIRFIKKLRGKIPDREETCDPCHAPQPILITGIGKMPKLREADRDSGVSCLVCHVDAKGAMHGPPASVDAVVHANITDKAHQTPIELCGSCHGQPSVPKYNQLASFKHSPAEKAGKNCATCHMPAIKRLQSLRSYEPMLGGRHTWVASRSV